MDKEKRKVLKKIMKMFEEKGINAENLEEMADIEEIKSKKRKLHEVEKINDLKEMINRSGEKYKDKPAFKYKTNKPNEFNSIKYGEFVEQINGLGTQLTNMGLVRKKDSYNIRK